MLLRSRCSNQCTVGHAAFTEKRGHHRHQSHHDYNHQHKDASEVTKVTMSRSWSRAEQMAGRNPLCTSSPKSDTNRLWSDDSDEEEERPKTDYTYVRSGFYSSRAPPEYVTERPNMSRPKLHSCLRQTHNYFTSSSEDSVEESQNLRHHQHGDSTVRISQPAHLQSDTTYGVLTALRPVRSAPAQVWENGSSQSGSMISSSSYHSYSTVESRSITRTIITTISSVWHYVWRHVYIGVCRVLVWDAWLLSKCRFLRSWKTLLPLLLAIFFLVYAASPHGIFHKSESSSHNHLSSLREYLIGFSSLPDPLFANWMGWKWFHFYSKQEANGDVLSVNQDSEGSGSHVGSLWGWLPSMTYFLSPKPAPAELRSESSQHMKPDVTRMAASMYMNRKVTRPAASMDMAAQMLEELASMRREMLLFTTHLLDLTKSMDELKGSFSQNLSQIKEHSQVLSAEISALKERFSRFESRPSVEYLLKPFEDEHRFLKDDLERLEQDFQLHALSVRNCCHNHSALLALSEERFGALLRQVMDEKHDDGATSPVIMRYREWLKSAFVGHDTLAAIMADLEDRAARNLSAVTKDMMEKVSALSEATASSSTADSHVNVAYRSRNMSVSEESWLLKDEVQRLIDNRLALYDADKTGLVDYALESAGGTVISTRCAETYSVGTARYSIFGIPIWHGSNSPRTVIQPEVHPGQCWAFRGSQGYLVIGLAAPVRPTAFTLEHIPKSLSVRGNIDSAPKDFSVWGLMHEDDYDAQLLGSYSYDQDGPPLQHFLVKDPNPGVFPIIELRILNNHGNMEYTCLYRFRVHGKKA